MPMDDRFLDRDSGIESRHVFRNTSPAVLYEEALRYEPGTYITSTGALVTSSGAKTGRCPKDKRIVEEETTKNDVWWGPVNIAMSEHVFDINRERAVDYLNTRPRLYVFDGFAGWDLQYRIKVRVICASAYHALFMHNMLIRPTMEELSNYGKPDFTILNAGEFPANKFTEGMTSNTSISVNFKTHELVILGTKYAGEMKKGIFSVMNYLMPKANILSLHSSANVGNNPSDVTIFFGLSGTGKTTLSADINRQLIGDDEHCWSDNGIFNIEGGCYAKCLDLEYEKEPEIFNAIRFGSVLENVVLDSHSRVVNYADRTITENTRCAYPIEYIPNAKIPCIAGHPKNIIMLTCDAFGVLPPISKLTIPQAMYHFISGYTAKIPGTEQGVTAPSPIFSACFGQPFLIWHPVKYATMLSERIHTHKADVWLINTGWSEGPYGVGKRIALKYSRAIIDAIHAGELVRSEYMTYPIFNLKIPTSVLNVPSEILDPRKTWLKSNSISVDEAIVNLAKLFFDNFKNYSDYASEEIKMAGPIFA